MIPKFIGFTAITIGSTVILHALDEDGVVWTYEYRLRSPETYNGPWKRLGIGRQVMPQPTGE